MTLTDHASNCACQPCLITKLAGSGFSLEAAVDVLSSTSSAPSSVLPPSPDTPGYCYLCVARFNFHEEIARSLGPDPFFFSVQDWISRNPSLLEPGKFTLQLGLAPRHSFSPAASYGHINRSESGYSAIQLLTITGHFRVGADTSDVNSATVASAPSRRITFIHQLMTSGERGNGSIASINFATVKKVVEITSVWPLVSFSDLSVRLLPTVETATLALTVTTAWHYASDTAPATRAQILNFEHADTVIMSGSLPGTTPNTLSLQLPSPTPFSTALKAPGSQNLHPALTIQIIAAALPGYELKSNVSLVEVLISMVIRVGI
jgi:hypothetical protein